MHEKYVTSMTRKKCFHRIYSPFSSFVTKSWYYSLCCFCICNQQEIPRETLFSHTLYQERQLL